MKQPDYFNYYAGKLFEAAGVPKDIGRRVCALHKACMEAHEYSFNVKLPGTSSEKTYSNRRDAASAYKLLKDVTHVEHPKFNTEYPILNQEGEPIPDFSASLRHTQNDERPDRLHESDIEGIMRLSEQNGWGLEYDRNIERQNVYGNYYGEFYEGFTYNRVSASYADGPDHDYSEEILDFVNKLGPSWRMERVIDYDETPSIDDTRYESYYIIYLPSKHENPEYDDNDDTGLNEK